MNKEEKNQIKQFVQKTKLERDTLKITEMGLIGQKIEEGFKKIAESQNTADTIRLMLEMEKVKGDDGYSPIKGQDYFTQEDISEFIEKSTPVKGEDYFTEKEINDFFEKVKPIKGKDYFDGKDGKIPEYGKDYFTKEQAKKFLELATPKKGEDYFDGLIGPRGPQGEKGEKGDKGDKPKHEWEGTKLRFENPDGTWGRFVDLANKMLNYGSRGVHYFKDLFDTPDSYENQAGKFLKVNSLENALEFGSGDGIGDTLSPATNTDAYIPQWNGANSKTLKDGLAVPAGGLAGITDLAGKLNIASTTYALLAGREGGQTLIGGTAVTDVLKLQGTSGNGTLTSPAVQVLVGNNGETTALTVLNNGNVGIGTTNPETKLHIANGDLLLSNNQWIRLEKSDGYNEAVLSLDGSNVLQVHDAAAGINFSIWDGSSSYVNKMTLQAVSGNVGIGTKSPGSKLDIKGAGTTTGITLQTQDSAGKLGLSVLDSGVTTIKGSLVTDSPTLGAELLTGGTWTSTDWTGNASGWTHTTGNVSPLSYSATVTVGNLYQIAVTRTSGVTGTATMTIGGADVGTISATAGGTIYYHTPKALTTAGLVITPGSTFDGTITVSVKQITAVSTPLFALQDSGGTARIEMRAGLNGAGNTFIGNGAGRYNTTGSSNSAQGYNALFSNTTGDYNSAQGRNALYANTTNIATLGTITGGSSYTNGTYNGVVMTLSSGSTATTYPTANIVVSGGAVTSVTLVTGGVGFKDTTTVLTAPAASIGGTGSSFTVPVATLAVGQNNNAIGYNAGRYITGGSVGNYIGTNSLFIGNGTQALADGQTNQIVIGDSAIGAGSNTVTLGNTSIVTTVLRGNVGIGTGIPTSKLQVVGLPTYADNTAALAGGLTAGAFYRTSAGVLMVTY